jgi:peptide/nickel transport system substrate-binding protein
MELDAIRADRAATEFRDYPPSAIDQLEEELGDQIVVQQSDWNCTLDSTLENRRQEEFNNRNS